LRNDEVQRKGFFGFMWIIANTFSWGILFLLAGAAGWIVWQYYQTLGYGLVSRLLGGESIRTLIALVICGLCWGAIVGGLQQWILARCFVMKGNRWLFATMVGLILYLIVQLLISFFSQSLMWFNLSLSQIEILIRLASAFIPPIVLGTSQWIILRRYFKSSKWWIVATTIAVGLAATITPWFARLILFNTPMVYRYNIYITVATFFIEGLLYGVATWMVLAIISRKPIVTSDANRL